ncbi:MAG: hypothetical protein LBL62_04605 [Planctomycetaceae bacterium]|jgi:hypothetical protein|nr:hypothetical protein [Planctomycetaceae bacterium]
MQSKALTFVLVGNAVVPLKINNLTVSTATNYSKKAIIAKKIPKTTYFYIQAVLKFTKLITEAQQREAVTRGRSLLRYI